MMDTTPCVRNYDIAMDTLARCADYLPLHNVFCARLFRYIQWHFDADIEKLTALSAHEIVQILMPTQNQSKDR